VIGELRSIPPMAAAMGKAICSSSSARSLRTTTRRVVRWVASRGDPRDKKVGASAPASATVRCAR
jgi:hypothetical protein